MGHSTSKEDSERRGWVVTGNTDAWRLLCKAVHPETGEYHVTKVLLLREGCLVQCDSVLGDKLVRTTTYCPSTPAAL